MYEIRHYRTADGQDVYFDWLEGLRDIKAKIAIIRRVLRIESGNFGDHKFCRDGVWELRVDVGPGYRYGRSLLAGLAKEREEMRDRQHDDAMAEMFRNDPGFAVELLNSILEDGAQSELLIVLRQMAKAHGGVQEVAELADLSATQLYRTLSPDGNPVLSTFLAVIKAIGLRLAVHPEQAPLNFA